MIETLISQPEYLYQELGYRRDKQWKIFSWASTILTAITAGVVVLKTREQPLHLTIVLQWILTWVVVVLVVSASGWIGYNRTVENDVTSQLQQLRVARRFPRAWVGYRTSLALLAVAAIAAIWIGVHVPPAKSDVPCAARTFVP
jgi:ABC-type uncharacterized transport system permease subunit